ncbi:MAG: hypothetical protein ACUVV3_03490 [Dehalococcoidia bacterium]
MSEEQGPGIRRYWELVRRGEEPDLAALVRAHPEEARQLVEADVARSRSESAATRRLLWEARQQVLVQAGGSGDTVEAMLKRQRLALGLAPEQVAQQARDAGQDLLGRAIENLESGRIPLSNVPPPTWKLLADLLHVDRWHLWALIKTQLSSPRTGLAFTRMERGTKPVDRGAFVEGVSARGAPADVDDYLEKLRRALESD